MSPTGSNWDGRTLDLSRLGMPLAVVTKQGLLAALSPAARDLLRVSGVSCGCLPASLPPSLWDSLRNAPLGITTEWTPEPGDGNFSIRLTPYPFDQEQLLVSMIPTSQNKENLSKQVYRSTQEVLSRLLAGAAHDLRSPLSTITFGVEVLLRRWKELPEDQVGALLQRCADSCKFQDNAISALVETVRLAEAVDISLGDLFDRIENMLRPLLRNKGDRLRILVDRTIRVRAALLSLDHIFVNLITNAVEANEKDSTITVRSSAVSPLRKSSGRRSVVSTESISRSAVVPVYVQDDGPGISMANSSHIFSPFFSTKKSGTGIGLCLARESARQSGGDLSLVSPPGEKGASFEVLLPVSRA